jgi:hypothetical protein
LGRYRISLYNRVQKKNPAKIWGSPEKDENHAYRMKNGIPTTHPQGAGITHKS